MARVLMVHLSYYPQDVRVRREAEALIKQSHEVDVICLGTGGQESVETVGGVTVHRIMDGRDKENFLNYILLTLVFMRKAFFYLNRLHRRRRFNVVHIHNMPDYLVFVTMWLKIKGIPTILDMHDLSVELYGVKFNSPKLAWMKPLVRWVEKLSTGYADHVITTSNGFRDRLLGRGVPADKITLVLNSADEKIFRPGPPREFRRIERGARLLYHGTVKEHFGLHVAVEAIAHLQKTVPGSTMSIYGNYSPAYRKDLEDLVEKLGIGEYVEFGGFLPLERIRELIIQADFGVVPYLDNTFMNLALSTKTFEYVRMELFVAGSRLDSGLSMFGEDCIGYFTPGDSQSLADTVTAFCLDPDRREDFVRRASEQYTQYSWETMANRYNSLINRYDSDKSGVNADFIEAHT